VAAGAAIIFMVIVPVTPRVGLDALVPQPPKNPNPSSSPKTAPSSSRVQAGAGAFPTTSLNETPVAKNELESKLNEMFSHPRREGDVR